MNKLLTTIVGAALGLTMTVGVGVAVANSYSKEPIPVHATQESFDLTKFAGQGTANTGSAMSATDFGITVEFNKGYYSSSTDVRNYAGGTISFSGATITAVGITATGTADNRSGGTWTVSSGGGNVSKSGATISWSGSTTSLVLANSSQLRMSALSITYSSGGTPISYTGVTVSQKTALSGTYKGDAYYECQATVTGTGAYSSAVTWSITSSTTYGSGTSITNKASIDSNGKITFLDNCTVYAWATAADGTTHNTSGFSVTASGLVDNPISTWTKITDDANVSVGKVYALSNDGTHFAANSVSSNNIALTSSLSSIGYVALESTDGGYYVRFATESAGVWSATGNYIKWANDGTKLSSTASSDSNYGKWNVVENSTNGVYLKNTSSNRHLGLNGSTDIRAYASSNLAGNPPVYLYEVGSLPVVACDTIQLTGKPTEDMSIGDTATLGYYALDGEANEWTGDVTYTISNEKDTNNNTTTGVVELSATSGASVTLTAKKAGSARVSVQDDEGNATADYADITVLADPTRVDLPVGTYIVTISAANEASDTVPATRDYEIKAKEGTGSERVWYKTLTVAFSNITVDTSYDEYVSAKTNGSLTVTNNSNASITDVEIHYYKYINDGVGIYVNDSILTPTSSTGTSGTDNDLYRGYTNIVGNTFSLCNKNSSYTNKFYSITITLTVADENEEFLSLVVSKDAGWSTAANGTYKDGQSPTNSGLIVTANYTTDGSSISRSEDVTSLVSNWAYTPSTLSTSDTSFSVVATWNEHNSASFAVTGISVEAISGDIDAGRYFIISQSGNTLDRVEVNAKACPQEDILSSASWTFTLVDDDTYTIHANIGGSEKYLTIGNDSQGLRTSGTSSDLWTVTAVSGGYTLLHNSSERYLVDYLAAGEQWRTYKSSNAQGYNTITLTEEKEVFADNFLNSFTAGCDADGGYTAADMDWTAAATQFATLSTANQNVFKTATYTKSGSGSSTVITPDTKVAKAVARYDYIVGKYGDATFSDFMLREPPALLTNKLMPSVFSDTSVVTTVVIVLSLVTLTAVGGYFFLKKKKEQ